MLFAEICSFVAVIESIRLADEFEYLIRNPPEHGTIWASDVSKENYFTIFEANAANLGSLDPSVVGHIAACYGFMKGSRDATRSLAGWGTRHVSDVEKSLELRAVARLVANSLVQADLAFGRLIAEDATLAHGMESVLPPQSIEKLARRWKDIAGEQSATQ
ncbi:MAG: hypothetical protein P4L64_11185 [Caulobacteraceae bacterium]|nr:hypothetical protein [Caulobacteraceae bacterium]